MSKGAKICPIHIAMPKGVNSTSLRSKDKHKANGGGGEGQILLKTQQKAQFMQQKHLQTMMVATKALSRTARPELAQVDLQTQGLGYRLQVVC